MADTTARPTLTEIQAYYVTQAREALAASKAPGWHDHTARNLGRLEATVEQLLQLVDELTGGQR